MIEVKNLNFTYGKGSKNSLTLKDINFTINKGEIFGFLGPSGAGKSTTQKIIIGILKNYLGSVKVMGKEVRNVKEDYYEKIGVSFELPNLYSKFTASENLSFFRGMYKGETEDINKLLAMVNLENYSNKKVSDFSKGMKMRLNFCRAFLNNPEIIFLDEPTSGLDPLNAKNIKDIILQKKEEGKTIFLTTHNMNVAEELCDRVAFIVDGRIKLIDSPRNLKIRKGSKNIKVEYKEDGVIKEEIFTMESIGCNNDFLKIIKEKKIERIFTMEATLEDIFIEVTGRSLS
ncbi:ABC transporter ATP-binding protein [Clostridium sp. MSJ-11]|uniref:ABC transporter ATP-binding protein n=1 Tax=Clostridium mobile TaxID=2841512 RepID=A0ABS6EFQ8_9CLOT|nr:ABC transporter ATP-binding protein [Clostridium mobile]MBU5484058.1 ABC transporter ATP-binding protein [Clostridium mobile]